MKPSKPRNASDRLRKFIAGQMPASGRLPFVHITRAYRFDDILSGDTLSPQHCEVFDEELVYFFYGRPAYRAKDGNNARLEFEWPIVFIFDPEKIGTIRRIFPFDTGAFASRLYEEFFDKSSALADYLLDSDIATPAKVVGAYYQDHDEYYRGETRKNVDIPLRQFEAQGVHELARLPGVQGLRSQYRVRDERSSAIEIQVAQDVNLRDAVIAVLLPQPYFGDSDIQSALARWNIAEVVPYQTLHNLSGDAWVGQIYAQVHQLYVRLGYL